MDENILIVRNEGADAEPLAARLAAGYGDDLGLVFTSIALGEEKATGGRIELERTYGGEEFNAFDEPIFLGSAIAQLAGHADAVVVDDLDLWCERLCQRFPDDPVELEAEVSSLTSVMRAKMSALVILAGGRSGLDAATTALRDDLIGRFRITSDTVVELGADGAQTVVKGSLDD